LHHFASIFLTLLIFLAGENLAEGRRTAPSNHPSLTLNHAPARYDFIYDLLGRRTTATAKNKLGTLLSNETYSYDLRSQLTGYAGTTGSIGYGYDSAGNLAGTKSATPGGYDVSYDYDTLNRITKVHRGQEGIDPNATQLAAYNYDANGNLNGTGYANGVQHAYTYNPQNRLTALNISSINNQQSSIGNHQSIPLQSYAYQLNKNGHRTQITELSGRTITNTFDKLHRLTAESISRSVGVSPTSSPEALGTLSYSYDSVGNRQSRTLTNATLALAALLPVQNQTFTVNDRLTTDTYDANGNTLVSKEGGTGVSPVSSSSLTDTYSFDNKLIRRTTPDGKTIDLTYTPDGHRLSKFITQNGLTQRLFHYLTDANNPTGYAQVIEEKQPLDTASPLKKVNLYGHDLIATESRSVGVSPVSSIFYNYDGLGSVRSITNATGNLTETYDYDAYGTLISLAKRNATSGQLESADLTNPTNKPTSEFLFTGEQWDADLGMVFLRSRYLNINTGRFHSQDTYEGRNGEPVTLHKYLYCGGNPVMFTDPSGKMTLGETSMVVGSLVSLTTIGNVANFFGFLNAVNNDSDQVPDAAIVSLGAGLRGGGFGGGGVLDAIYFFNTGKIFLYLGGAFGIEPISYFRSASAKTTNLSGGLLYNINSPSEWSGLGYSSSFPVSFARILGRAFAGKNGAYGALMQLAKLENLGKYNHTLQFSNSSSGPAAIKVGSKSSTFSTDVGWLLDPIDINQLASEGGTYLAGVTSQISSTATALKANFANSLKIFN
jgi:RHS repeat-associated protein